MFDNTDLFSMAARKYAAAAANHRETIILSGCSKCGRRLVQDDKPIPGATLVIQNDLSASRPPDKAMCGDCLLEITGEKRDV